MWWWWGEGGGGQDIENDFVDCTALSCSLFIPFGEQEVQATQVHFTLCVMHLSICCPTLPLLGCIGYLSGDLTQDFPPGVGNLTVKSLMLSRGSIEMYLTPWLAPCEGNLTLAYVKSPLFPLCCPVGGGWGNTLIGA